MKPKRCKSCREPFTPSRPLQSACGVQCAIALTNAAKEKARKAKEAVERKEHREAKERVKTRSDHMREAQQAFNEFIRWRDRLHPCISCDSTPSDEGLITASRWDAGHYRSVGACPALRFEPLNTNRQCVRCNRDLSGNAVGYRIRLIRRIGQDKVDWLEGPHEPKRYTIDDLKAIKTEYRAKVRELKKSNQEEIA